MAPTLEQEVKSDPEMKRRYVTVRRYARTLLGGIHHVCTNDFRTPGGAVVWTAHGLQHSQSLVHILDDLAKLPSVQNANISLEEKCALLCAAWLHDVGMFLCHPDFPNLAVQRKYHGRIARTMLAHMPHRSCLPSAFLNQIAEICELHQAKTSRILLSSPTTTLLGNLLLMADALDIGWRRTSKAKEGGAVLDMIRNTTTISETSAIEWWVNDCISNTNIDARPDNTLEVTATVVKKQLRKWKEIATHQRSTLRAGDEETLLGHLYMSLHQYLDRNHVGAIRQRGGRWCYMIKKVGVALKMDGKLYHQADLRYGQPRSYHKARQLWSEQLSTCDLSVIRTDLQEVKSAVAANQIYLFVHDGMSDTIRYLHNDVILQLNRQTDHHSYIMQKQRIQRKCGIIGHVAFCALITAVEDLREDPRRCYEREDGGLKLHSLMFSPLVKVKDRSLWGVIMVNREETGDPGVPRLDTYRLRDARKFGRITRKHEGAIVAALERYSKPYLD